MSQRRFSLIGSGTISGDTGISTINPQNGDYTLVLTDAGSTIAKSSGGAGETFTIPANASVAFEVGTLISFSNDGGGDVTIAITSDTLEDVDGATGSQVLSDDHVALIQKIGSTKWRYSSTSTSAGLSSLVGDATPQLGGDLDVQSHKIVSVSNADIDIEPHGTGNVLLGNLEFDADQTVGAGQDNYVLTYDDGDGEISLEASAGGGGAPEGTAIVSTGESGGTKFLREDGDNTCSWQVPGGGGTPEGTVILSTGETGGSKFLREDGDNSCSWQAAPGSGATITFFQVEDDGSTGQATTGTRTDLDGMWGTPSHTDSDFSWNGSTGILTVNTTGKVCFNVAVAGKNTGANRCELHADIYKNGSAILIETANYATRDSSQDEGNVVIAGFLDDAVATDTYRLRVSDNGVSMTIGHADVAGMTYFGAKLYT